MSRVAKKLWVASIAIGIALSAAPADAQEPERRLVWSWNRFNTLDYVSTAVLGATFFVIEFGTEAREEPNWEGPILFDEGVRDLLVADTREGRDTHAKVSDYSSIGSQALLFFDSAAVPMFFDRWNFDVAWQLTMINLQALALSAVIARSGHHFIGRERPDVDPCEQDPEYSAKCFGGSNASFPGGHTQASVVAATLNCVHHFKLGLYGNEIADASACGVGIAVASAVTVERLMADRHWASDQVVGIGLGLGAGLGVPLLLHYKPRADSSAGKSVRWTIAPAPEGALGMSVYGWM